MENTENEMDTREDIGLFLGLHRGYIGIKENRMETTIWGLGFVVPLPKSLSAGKSCKYSPMTAGNEFGSGVCPS